MHFEFTFLCIGIIFTHSFFSSSFFLFLPLSAFRKYILFFSSDSSAFKTVYKERCLICISIASYFPLILLRCELRHVLNELIFEGKPFFMLYESKKEFDNFDMLYINRKVAMLFTI